MSIDPNHDIVPSLRMFNGLLMDKAADEIERLRAENNAMREMLVSARAIAQRQGEATAWQRFDESVAKLGIGWVTARVYTVLPSDDESEAA